MYCSLYQLSCFLHYYAPLISSCATPGAPAPLNERLQVATLIPPLLESAQTLHQRLFPALIRLHACNPQNPQLCRSFMNANVLSRPKTLAPVAKLD